MALYSYQAFSKEGKKVTGTIDAPTLASAREKLTAQGVYPISITLATAESTQSWWQRLFTPKVTAKERIIFTKQLAVLLKAGIPLLQSLELLVDQFEGTLRTVLIKVKDDLKEGSSLADALRKYPKVFNTIYVQLVRAGEASGKLEVILERLTTYLERREALAKRIKDALFMPMVQLIMAVVIVVGLMIKIVPSMAKNFARLGKELPLPTKILMAMSDFLVHYYLILAGIVVVVVLAFNYWKRTNSGKLIIDRILLKLPLIKYFAKMNAIVQFSYTLGMLIEGGVNLAESLDIVCAIIDNKVLANALNEARDKIIKQGKIAQYLKQTGIFPPMAIYLINTGEQSGQLDAMLLNIAQNYEEELKELSDKLSALLSPILLVVMAAIVGFIVISLVLPMTQMADLSSIVEI